MASTWINDELFKTPNANGTIWGLGANDQVAVMSGLDAKNVTINNVETYIFAGNAADFRFQNQNGTMVVFAADGVTQLARFAVTPGSLETLKFVDGSFTAALQAGSNTVVELKGTGAAPQVLASQAPVAAVTVTVDPTGASSEAVGGGGGGVGELTVLSATVTTANMTLNNDTVDAATNVDSINNAIVADNSLSDHDVANVKLGIGKIEVPQLMTNVETVNVDFSLNSTFNATNVSYGGTAGTTIVAKTTAAGNSTANISGLSNRNVNVQVDSSIKALNLDGTAATTDAVTVLLNGGNLTLDASGSNLIDNITLKGATAANTVTLTGTNLGTGGVITLAGDQNIDLKATAAEITGGKIGNTLTGSAKGVLHITDDAMSGATGSGDYSKVDTKVAICLDATSSNAGTGLFANGATVILNANDAASGDIFTAGTGTGNTLNLVLNKASASGTDKVETSGIANLVLTNNVINGGLGDIKNNAAQNITLLGSQNFSLDDWTVASGGVFNAAGFGAKLELSAGSSSGVTIIGSNNGDKLAGGASGDTIIAGNGNDVITITAGADQITGGLGNDTFMIGSGATGSTITDFAKANDKLVLTGAFGATGLNLTNIGTGDWAANGKVTFGGSTAYVITLQEDGQAMAYTKDVSAFVTLGASGNAFTFGGDSGLSLVASQNIDYLATSGTTGVSITAGKGGDIIDLTATSGAIADNIDTLVIKAGDSTITAWDQVTSFMTVATGGDTLDLVSTVVYTDNNGSGSGTALTNADGTSGTFNIYGNGTASGVYTVTNNEQFQFEAFTQALARTEALDGKTIAFAALGSTWVFQGHADAGMDTLVQLVGTAGVEAIATGAPAANTIIIA